MSPSLSVSDTRAGAIRRRRRDEDRVVETVVDRSFVSSKVDVTSVGGGATGCDVCDRRDDDSDTFLFLSRWSRSFLEDKDDRSS